MNPVRHASSSVAAVLDSQAWKLTKDLAVFACMTLLGLVTWHAKQILTRIEDNTKEIHANGDSIEDLEKWQAVTNGNIFTTKDGLELQKQISIMCQRLPTEFPPKDWQENVYRRDLQYINGGMTDIKDGLKEVQTGVKNVESMLRDHMLENP